MLLAMLYGVGTADASVQGSLVRLTPLEQSKRGAIWNTAPVEMRNWVVSMVVHIVGGVVRKKTATIVQAHETNGESGLG